MYHVIAQGVDERMINVHDYYYYPGNYHNIAGLSQQAREASVERTHGINVGQCWGFFAERMHACRFLFLQVLDARAVSDLEG